MNPERMTDEELVKWVLRQQADHDGAISGTLPPTLDWCEMMKCKTPIWHHIDDEQAYRRGFTHGMAYASELIIDLFQSGFIRPREIANIIYSFNAQTLYRWRYDAYKDCLKGDFSVRCCHPKLHQDDWKIIRERILDRDFRRCVNCGSDQHLHIDHIDPVANGGTPEDSNLQTLCRNCNCRKGAA